MVVVEGQFDVITLNVHAVRKKICLVTKRHAERRGKPLFFTHLELPYFLDHKNHFFPPEKSCMKCPCILWSERCMALYVTGSHSSWRDAGNDHLTNSWRGKKQSIVVPHIGSLACSDNGLIENKFLVLMECILN
jgi:hypothetical protein